MITHTRTHTNTIYTHTYIKVYIYIYIYIYVCVWACYLNRYSDCPLTGQSGKKFGCERNFRPSRPALGASQPPVKWAPVLSRGYSAAGACR